MSRYSDILTEMADHAQRIISLGVELHTLEPEANPQAASILSQLFSDPRLTPLFAPPPPAPLVRTREHPAEHLPQNLVDFYEFLYLRVYGPTSVYIGDPNKVKDSGKAFRGRTSTAQTETRAGAHNKKSLSASRTSVIKDQQAYTQKQLIDKKLRHISREIKDFLNGAPLRRNTLNCPSCNLIQNRSSNFCSHCGVGLRYTPR